MSEFTFLRGPADWWRQAVVYQIYPRSFADRNGDGIGDFAGIIDRIPYLVALGIDAVWLSPFYPSELADGGYDVADYRNVDPRIGTLAEFDTLVQGLHQHGIRLFVDIVPNHSSDQHEWFQAALAAGPGSPERDRYIFRDGKGEHGELPPSRLVSHFGPEGWTRVADGQWYLHMFAKEQPDLNWANPEVREDFLKTIRFWCDRGVDGFRVDVAHSLIKDLEGELPERDSYDLAAMKNDGTDRLLDRDEVHDVYRSWRKVFNEYDPPRIGVAEAWVHANRRPAYASPEGLGQAFNFDLLVQPFDRDRFFRTIDSNVKAAKREGASTTWVLSNHDNIRHATRYGWPRDFDTHTWQHNNTSGNQSAPPCDERKGEQRARAAIMLLLALPGSTYLYQGEELGLQEVFDIPADKIQDPQWFRSGGQKMTRDGCRVPLPWQATGSSFGFGSNGAHLPQPTWFGRYAVAVEEADEQSTLSLYRKALGLRRQLQTDESMRWVRGWNRNVLHFKRPNGWHCITNFGDGPVRLPKGPVLVSSAPIVNGMLPGNATAWFMAR